MHPKQIYVQLDMPYVRLSLLHTALRSVARILKTYPSTEQLEAAVARNKLYAPYIALARAALDSPRYYKRQLFIHEQQVDQYGIVHPHFGRLWFAHPPPRTVVYVISLVLRSGKWFAFCKTDDSKPCVSRAYVTYRQDRELRVLYDKCRLLRTEVEDPVAYANSHHGSWPLYFAAKNGAVPFLNWPLHVCRVQSTSKIHPKTGYLVQTLIHLPHTNKFVLSVEQEVPEDAESFDLYLFNREYKIVWRYHDSV